MSGQTPTLGSITALELRWCILANRFARSRMAARFFGWISRLGDGVFWYGLMVVLPLVFGVEAIPASLHMAVTGLAALGIYYSLKGMFRRPRPFRQAARIRLSVPPLDEFSFPSGHTLQAVSFTLVALAWYPVLAWILVPFTLLVTVSRVVLGLHYPSDVLAAVVIGTLLAASSLMVWPL